MNPQVRPHGPTPNARLACAPGGRHRNRSSPSNAGRHRRGEAGRSTGTTRWNDALAERIAVQTECAAWFDALPESLRDSAPAAALQDRIDLDLDAIAAIQPPLAMVVTDRRATTFGRSVAPRTIRGKSWVLARLAPKRGLRVAPVPPRAAILNAQNLTFFSCEVLLS